VTVSPSLRYLSAADVTAAMPPLVERLELAEITLRALRQSAELPAKIGVHPRQPGSLAHAMPALLRGSADDGGDDLMGVKWIVGFPDNPAIGLPTYHAQVILSDSRNGRLLAILDAGTITAQRTAAVSGVAIKLFAPRHRERPAAVAVLGAGVQARGHLPVIGRLLPEASVRIADVDRARAESLAVEARSIDGIREATAATSVRQAVEGADVVVSVVSFGPDHQALDPRWLAADTLFVAVDYDMQAPAALAREALFVVDERDQFLATRVGGGFAGYPDPAATLGEALRDGIARPAGRILVSHLGVGLADVVFASAILKRAEELGLGVLLAR
jgi:ornithine cyclodeaminase/alanine dehydrogenase-like protein (mu-crystallin family)